MADSAVIGIRTTGAPMAANHVCARHVGTVPRRHEDHRSATTTGATPVSSAADAVPGVDVVRPFIQNTPDEELGAGPAGGVGGAAACGSGVPAPGAHEVAVLS